MRGLTRLLNVLATLMLLIIGGGLLANSFGLIDISELLFGTEFLASVIGGGMLLLGLIVIFVAVQNVRPEQAISIQNPEGEVRITFGAIEELLKKASCRIEGIGELKPKVNAGKKGLEIYNRISVEAGASIPEITTRIQDVIKAQIKGVLGIDEIGTIRTYVNKIITEETDKDEKNESI